VTKKWRRWADDEVATLRRLWPDREALAAALPGRTLSAIELYAAKNLRLHMPRPGTGRNGAPSPGPVARGGPLPPGANTLPPLPSEGGPLDPFELRRNS